jgi:hypothetical protein
MRRGAIAAVSALRLTETVAFPKEARRSGWHKRVTECEAKIVGGWDRGNGDTGGHLGVRLDLLFTLRCAR